MASTTLSAAGCPSQLCSSKNGIYAPSYALLYKPTKGLGLGKDRRMKIACQATSISVDRVPDMGKRKLMNLILLGAISLPTAGMLIPYTYFFVPPGFKIYNHKASKDLYLAMNYMSDQHENLTVILKYSGVLMQVKNQLRRRYDGGKQKSITFLTNNLNLLVLRGKVELICPWVRGCNYELYYHIYRTSPKDYTLIHDDNEVKSMIVQSIGTGRVEVVVAHEDNGEAIACPQGGQVRANIMPSDNNDSSSNFVYNDNITQEDWPDKLVCTQPRDDAQLQIGAQFCDAESFRHAVRSTVISQNFGVRFIANNRSRVVAICSYRGCTWRVYGSLCRDGSYFEIRKLEARHLCPGINRAGNKQATSSWVAKEIEESIERNPNITPKLKL